MIFTIVTPSYNQGAFLGRTIESVLNQEGDFRIDYIIMDGGSDDNSVEIIRSYQKRVESGEYKILCNGITLRWISEKDGGQGDAIRKGFLMAKGTILAWLNSDDFYMPEAFQSVVDIFRNNSEISLIYGDCGYCDEHGNAIGRYPAAEFDFARLASFNFIPQPSTFFRLDAYHAAGGLDDSLRYVMDFDLVIRICKGAVCHYLPHQLSCYRLHGDSKTVMEDGLFDNHEEALRVVIKYFSWAPFNLLYGSCSSYFDQHIPDGMKKSRLLRIVISLAAALIRSLWLNHGIDLRDLKLLNRENLRKLFITRREILLG